MATTFLYALQFTFNPVDATAAPVDIAVAGVKAGDRINSIVENTPDGFGSDLTGLGLFRPIIVADGKIRQQNSNMLGGLPVVATITRVAPPK